MAQKQQTAGACQNKIKSYTCVNIKIVFLYTFVNKQYIYYKMVKPKRKDGDNRAIRRKPGVQGKPFKHEKQQYKSNKSHLPNATQWRRKKPQDEVSH